MSSGKVTRFQNNVRVDGDLDLSSSTGKLTVSSLSSAPSSPAVGMVYYDTSLQKARIYQDSGWTAVDGTAAGSLDAAYNGGATVTVDAGAVTLTDSQTNTAGGFLITKSGVVTGSDSASVMHINSTGAHDTSGTLKFVEISVGAETASTIIGIEVEMNANGDDAILLTKGAMTITDGALTLSSGNLDVTGTLTISSTINISGTATMAAISNSGTITSQGIVIIDVDNAEAFLIRENGDAADVFVVDTTQDAGDTSVEVESKTTSGFAFRVDADTTTGAAVMIDADAVTTGDALRISVASGTMGATGSAISVIDSTNADVEVFAVRDDGTIYSKATAEGTTAFEVVTGDVLLSDGDLTLAGGELAVTDGVTTSGSGLALVSSITTSSAGAFAVTGNSLTSGTLALLTTSGTVTGIVLDISAASLTTGKVIDISNLDAITTGKAIHIDATGATQTSGVLVHIDGGSTALTTSGRLLLVDQTADFNDTGGAVVEIKSSHTTGVGLLMSLDSITDGFGLDMTADGLTSGSGARFITSSTGLTTAGNVLYVQASADFNDAGGQVMEIESAHTTGTGLQMTMDAITDGLGLFMTIDALTSGQGISIASSATAITGNGRLLRVDHTGSTGTTAIISEFATAATDETVLTRFTASGALSGAVVEILASSMIDGTGLKIDTIQTSGAALHIDNASGVQSGNTGMVFLDHGGDMADGSNIIRIAPTGTPVEGAVGIEIVGGSKVMQGLVIDSDAATKSANIFTGDGQRGANTAVVEVLANVASGSNADSAVLRVIQDHTGGVSYCVDLQQDDLNVGFINFEGTATADENSPISTHGTGTTTDFVRCAINGTLAWIPVVTGTITA